MRRWIGIFCFLLVVPATWASAQVSSSGGPLLVNIDNPSFRRLVVALPTFSIAGTTSGELQTLAAGGPKELGRLLTYSGLFNVMAEEAYSELSKKMVAPKSTTGLGVQTKAGMENVDVPQWKALGIESLTVGEIEQDGDGFSMSLRTIDMNRGEMLIGKKYTKVKRAEFDLVLRRYADLILRAYTGKPGIFSSRLTFVGRRAAAQTKQIFISDFDGRNVIQITKDNTTHLSPAWSPDGRFISYTSYRDGNPDLYSYEVATGKVRKLSGAKGLNSGSSWSPDGKIVVLTGSVGGDTDIYYIPAEGGSRSLLIRGAGLDVDPEISPDKKWIVFVSGRYGNPHIFRGTLAWDGDAKPRVTEDKRLTYAGWYNATPSFSNESDKIAFAGYDKDIDRFDLFLMNSDGTNLERLTIRVGDNENPSWSPNGQMIVFQSNRMGSVDKKGTTQIWVMNRDGSSQRQISQGLYDAQQPAWSLNIE